MYLTKVWYTNKLRLYFKHNVIILQLWQSPHVCEPSWDVIIMPVQLKLLLESFFSEPVWTQSQLSLWTNLAK